MEKILIKVIEEKIENLKETKIERVKEIAKEHKLDVAYETLMKYEKDAEGYDPDPGDRHDDEPDGSSRKRYLR